MADFAIGKGMDQFSIIGHSQGGLVATHLLNYYWTGLANASGMNPISFFFCSLFLICEKMDA